MQLTLSMAIWKPTGAPRSGRMWISVRNANSKSLLDSVIYPAPPLDGFKLITGAAIVAIPAFLRNDRLELLLRSFMQWRLNKVLTYLFLCIYPHPNAVDNKGIASNVV